MSQPRMDNGDAFMRAHRDWLRAQQQAQYNQYNPYHGSMQEWVRWAQQQRFDPPIAGEPEREDTTGLKMLEEFLAKRKGERDGK